jgi:hypothetical protein
MKKNRLFNTEDINDRLDDPYKYIEAYINKLNKNALANDESSLKKLISYELKFDVPIDESNTTEENDNNHPNETTHVVPFEGKARCFEYKTNLQDAYPPNGVIRYRGSVMKDKADLLIFVSEEAVSMSQYNSFDMQLQSIKMHLLHLAAMTQNFNLILEKYCSQLISARKEYLRKN